MTHPTTFPPGPATNWLTPLTLSKTLLPFLQNNAQQYGDITSFKLLGRRVFQLNHPDAIQAVLVKNAEHFHKSPNLKRATREAIGNGLLTSDGALHKRQRQLVQPAFHSQRISAYAATMVQYTEELLQHWQSGAHYDLLHEMNKLTMRIVTKTLFDVDIIDQADELGAAITLGIETANERILRPLP